MVSHTNGFIFVGVLSIVNVDLLNEVDTIIVCSAYGCIVVEVDVDAKVVVHKCCIAIHFLHLYSSHKSNQVEKKKKKMGWREINWVFQDVWRTIYKLCLGEIMVGLNRKVNMVKVHVCTQTERREKLLVPKFDNL